MILNDEGIFEDIARQVFREVCGIEMSHAQYMEHFHGAPYSHDDTYAFIFSHGCKDASLVDDVFAREDEIYSDLIAAGKISCNEHALVLIDQLHALGYRQGIVTAMERRHVETVLRTIVPNKFDVVVTETDLPQTKPDPAPYEFAARLLEHAPHECLALDDSCIGVRAARSAGTVVIGRKNPMINMAEQSLFAAGADVVISTDQLTPLRIQGIFETYSRLRIQQGMQMRTGALR